jgi:hypothetical protein
MMMVSNVFANFLMKYRRLSTAQAGLDDARDRLADPSPLC